MLLEIKIIDDPVASHSPSPCGRRSLESLKITLKGIVLHRNEDRFNARLISLRELLEVFLRRTGEVEVPRHGGMPSKKVHRRDYKRPGRDAARKVPQETAHRQDSGSRNRPATPRGQVRSGCAILFSAPPRTDRAAREGVKRSWFRWFSWFYESYSVRLVLILLLPEDMSRTSTMIEVNRLPHQNRDVGPAA